MKWSESCSVVSDSLWPQGLYSPWNSPGQNTGVGSLSLLWGIFPTQGSNPGLLHCRWVLYCLSHKGYCDRYCHVWRFATPWTVGLQTPLSMGISKQDDWSGLPCPPPGDLPNPGIELKSLSSPALSAGFFTIEPFGKPSVKMTIAKVKILCHWAISENLQLEDFFFFLDNWSWIDFLITHNTVPLWAQKQVHNDLPTIHKLQAVTPRQYFRDEETWLTRWNCQLMVELRRGGFPSSSDGKASACNAGDLGSIPGSGRSPGEGNGDPLQYSCLENPMDRGALWAAGHGVAKSQTRLRD